MDHPNRFKSILQINNVRIKRGNSTPPAPTKSAFPALYTNANKVQNGFPELGTE